MALGGPIVRESRFFGSYRYTRSKEPRHQPDVERSSPICERLFPASNRSTGRGGRTSGFIKGHHAALTRGISCRGSMSSTSVRIRSSPVSAIGAALLRGRRNGRLRVVQPAVVDLGISRSSTRFACPTTQVVPPGRSLRTDPAEPSGSHRHLFPSSGPLAGHWRPIALLDNQTISDYIQPADKLSTHSRRLLVQAGLAGLA